MSPTSKTRRWRLEGRASLVTIRLWRMCFLASSVARAHCEGVQPRLVVLGVGACRPMRLHLPVRASVQRQELREGAREAQAQWAQRAHAASSGDVRPRCEFVFLCCSVAGVLRARPSGAQAALKRRSSGAAVASERLSSSAERRAGV